MQKSDKWENSIGIQASVAVILISLFTPCVAIAEQVQNQAAPAEVRKLELGKPIEREMKGSESHTYEIILQAGQYLNAVVEQKGIDVVVQVIAPDGKQLMEVDSPNGTQGPEPVHLIAEAAGNYKLKVGSLEKVAPLGRYEIRVNELHAASEKDRAFIEKERVLLEATNLQTEAENLRLAGKYDAALPLAERALAIREKALGAEHPDTAQTLNNLAALYQATGNFSQAAAATRLPIKPSCAISRPALNANDSSM